MREPQLIQSKTELPIAEIGADRRLRPVSEAGVEAILSSVAELGQIVTPLTVRQRRADGALIYELLDGAHRLEAARRLGVETVPVRVFDCTNDQAALLEIDGNLAGAELNPLDTAVFLATRKAVYERLHPETKRGVAGSSARWGDASELGSFASMTAEKFGMTVRQVQKIVAAGSRLGPDEIAQLRAAPKPVTLKDLQVIAKIGHAPERYDVVRRLADGGAKSAAEARQKWKVSRPDYSGPVPPSADDAAYIDLLNRFDRAPMAAKRRFVETRWVEMARIMRDAEPVADGAGDVAALGEGLADDDLYAAAVMAVRSSQNASTAHLQRKLGVGYNIAARLMERMEAEGVVTTADEIGRRGIMPTDSGWAET